MRTVHELIAPPEAAGERLDRWLAQVLPDLSRSRIARLVESGQALVDGAPAKASLKLKGGERVTCELPPPDDGGLVATEMPLSILFEDEHLLAIDKPAGLVVHPGAGTPEATLVHALLHHCGPSLADVGGPGRPGLVHRLDKGTTGVLVVAKTSAAHLSLVAQFAARTVAKTYLGVVLGVPPLAGRVEAPIARSARTRTRMAVRAQGRPALSDWRVAETFGASAALVEIALHTGRTHQARVHMAHVGHALAGDTAYRGGAEPEAWARGLLSAFPRPALHAFRLEVDHPATGERIAFEAPLPQDLRDLLEALRAAAAKRRA